MIKLISAMGKGGRCYDTVSYTHLDVYKRQMFVLPAVRRKHRMEKPSVSMIGRKQKPVFLNAVNVIQLKIPTQN